MKNLLSFLLPVLLASGILVSCETTDSTNTSTVTTLETTTTSITTKIPTTTEVPTSSTEISTPEAPTTTASSTTTEVSTTIVSTTAQSPTTDQPTTSPPITTERPKPNPVPSEGSWNITENNVTCIRAEIKAMFTINIKGKNYKMALSPNATSVGSTCNDNGTQKLELSEEDKYTFTMIFRNESDKVFVNNITLSYKLPEHEGSAYNNDTLFSVKTGNSYLCKSNYEMHLIENVTVDFYEIHIQAFISKDETDFGAPDECAQDDTISDAIPIAVGCALAALIVIVLIAYLVGRRQSRQRGYQSV